MSGAAQALATIRDYIERSTHWREGGADRHEALKIALPEVEEMLTEMARPVGSILKGNIKQQQGPWCREVLLYSPDNQGDSPGSRVMLYTAGRLDDALEWAEKGVAEWRSVAQENARQAAVARVAINHLQSVLNKPRTHAEQQAADAAARDWLTSIGSDP